MNRWKKYLRTKGFKLECDYPCIPYHMECDSVEGVTTYIENKSIYLNTYYWSLGKYTYCIETNGKIKHIVDGEIIHEE